MDPVLFVLDVGVLIYAGLLAYALLTGKAYFGRRYERNINRMKYMECLFAYMLIIVGLIGVRFFLVSRLEII